MSEANIKKPQTRLVREVTIVDAEGNALADAKLRDGVQFEDVLHASGHGMLRVIRTPAPRAVPAKKNAGKAEPTA